jgi:hypothetical protein
MGGKERARGNHRNRGEVSKRVGREGKNWRREQMGGEENNGGEGRTE